MNTSESWYVVIIIVFLIVYTLKQLNKFRDLRGIFLTKSKKEKLDQFFGRYFHYYNQLPKVDKKRFVSRANNLANSLKIIGRQGFEVSEKEKLFVVAAQVQITFGFRNYFLPMFQTIFIYPDSYRNPVTGNLHDGEVNPKGLIVLSWRKLVKGHIIPDDRINLGLHEFAHALMHTIMHSKNHELGLDVFLDKIVNLSKSEIVKIKSSENNFFRKYAGTNIFEFFAIAVEYFFEVSEDFKKELPELYNYLVDLLKQDPANRVFRK